MGKSRNINFILKLIGMWILMFFILPIAVVIIAVKTIIESIVEWVENIKNKRNRKRSSSKKEEKPHEVPSPDENFLFKDIDKIMGQQRYTLCYVRNAPDENIRRFFHDKADFLEQMTEKYSVGFSSADIAEIANSLIYPEDITAFKHGFLYYAHRTNGDNRYFVSYFELNPLSAMSMEQQIDDIMHKVYQRSYIF